jgi:hypothetical protein
VPTTELGEIMKEREKKVVERFERLRERMRTDSTLWRLALADAAMSLLRAGTPVTIDTLLVRLREPLETDDPPLTAGTLEGAIDRLQKLRSEVEGDHAK